MVKKIALLFDENKEFKTETIEKAVSVLAAYDVQIFISSKIKGHIKNNCLNFFDDISEMISSSDASVVFGGDGSIIYFSKLCAKFNKPILGINTGKMGFLSTIEKSEIDKLKRLANGDYITENHFLLEINHNNENFLALNEFAVNRGSFSRMLDFEIYKSGERILSFRADGVIVSTPAGSTAYSFSAGGPIIDNDANCVAVTPVCPQEISCRPIILSCEDEISIKTYGEVILNADSVGKAAKLNGEMVKIKKADAAVKFIRFSKNHFYKNFEKKILKRGVKP